MDFAFDPYVRFAAKTTYFIRDRELVAKDARLLYILSGSGTFTSEGITHKLCPCTLVYYPYNVPYRISSDTEDGMLFYTVNFDFTQDYSRHPKAVPLAADSHDPKESFPSMNAELEKTFGRVICSPNALWAVQDLEGLYEEALEQKEGGRQLQSLYLKKLLITLYRTVQTEASNNPLCRRIKEEISAFPGAKIKDIAAKLSYHPYYLNEVFKKEEGVTLHSYIAALRLKKAYELLTGSRCSLEEIARLCGFSSQAHMASAFRTSYGISPGALRKQM